MTIVLNNCWYFKSNYILAPLRKINYNNSDKLFGA